MREIGIFPLSGPLNFNGHPHISGLRGDIAHGLGIWPIKTLSDIIFREGKSMIRAAHPQTVGISAIASYEPPWLLGNDWFSEMLPRKFVHHTGILSRHISTEDEVAIAARAVEESRAGVGLRPAIAPPWFSYRRRSCRAPPRASTLMANLTGCNRPTGRHESSSAAPASRRRKCTASTGVAAVTARLWQLSNAKSCPRGGCARTNT